jgi:uncharacterized C2H2 Zn-finger protein
VSATGDPVAVGTDVVPGRPCSSLPRIHGVKALRGPHVTVLYCRGRVDGRQGSRAPHIYEFLSWEDDIAMANRLLASLTKLALERQGLKEEEEKIAGTERGLIMHLGQELSTFGYRLVAADGRDARTRAARPRRRAPRNTLRCPKCDRRFSYPMHVARHLSAMHGAKKAAQRARKRPTTLKLKE